MTQATPNRRARRGAPSSGTHPGAVRLKTQHTKEPTMATSTTRPNAPARAAAAAKRLEAKANATTPPTQETPAMPTTDNAAPTTANATTKAIDAALDAAVENPAPATLDLSSLGIVALVKPTRPCACGWTVLTPGNAIEDGRLKGKPKAHRDAAEYDKETDTTSISLPCGGVTQSTFAPGHDARLKGLALTAATTGGDLSKDGVRVDPWTLLAALAPNLLAFLPAKPAPATPATDAA